MLGNHSSYSIFRKEWRTRGLLLVVLMAFTACGIMHFQFAIGTFLCASIALWSGWLSHEERDPARAYLTTLPISRGRVLGVKLMAAFSQWLILCIVFATVFNLSLA